MAIGGAVERSAVLSARSQSAVCCNLAGGSRAGLRFRHVRAGPTGVVVVSR